MDKLQLHEVKRSDTSLYKKKFRNRKIRARLSFNFKTKYKTRLIKLIVILLIGYVSIFCGLSLLNSINKGKAITSNWITEQRNRIECYDMIQYQIQYPDTELTKQSEELCKEYR